MVRWRRSIKNETGHVIEPMNEWMQLYMYFNTLPAQLGIVLCHQLAIFEACAWPLHWTVAAAATHVYIYIYLYEPQRRTTCCDGSRSDNGIGLHLQICTSTSLAIQFLSVQNSYHQSNSMNQWMQWMQCNVETQTTMQMATQFNIAHCARDTTMSLYVFIHETTDRCCFFRQTDKIRNFLYMHTASRKNKHRGLYWE